jgi:hypothetical protein
MVAINEKKEICYRALPEIENRIKMNIWRKKCLEEGTQSCMPLKSSNTHTWNRRE